MEPFTGVCVCFLFINLKNILNKLILNLIIDYSVWILSITLLLTIMNNVPTNGDCPSPLKIDRECASQFLYFGKRDSILTFDDGLYIQNCE